MNMKTLLILCLMIAVATGGFWRRRRRRRNNSGRRTGPTVSGSLECPGGRCQGTLSVEKKWGDSTSLSGHVTCGGGGCGGGVRFTHRFKRGISKTDKFEISIGLDVCDFESYDGNDNNKIEKEEMVLLFGDDVLTDVLFEVLDSNDDGFISIDEFNTGAPKHIETC